MKNNKFIALSAILAICFGITGCNNNNANDNDLEGDVVLNVYNCADYICETDEESGTIGVVEQFEQYCKDTYNVNVKVNYSTYETNEDMYNQLRAGGIQYDLICPSDYMIDKLIMNDMILPLTSQIENYENYGSKYIRTTFDEITSHTSDGQEVKFKDYAIPYMWGTMGFMYDPNPKGLKEEEIPLSARIMAIADVFDALVSKRCYKEPIPVKEAFEIIKDESGTHFDPDLVDVFLNHKDKFMNE